MKEKKSVDVGKRRQWKMFLFECSRYESLRRDWKEILHRERESGL